MHLEPRRGKPEQVIPNEDVLDEQEAVFRRGLHFAPDIHVVRLVGAVVVIKDVPLPHPVHPRFHLEQVLHDRLTHSNPSDQPLKPLVEVVLMHPEVADRTAAHA